MLTETPASGKPPIQLEGDLAHTGQNGLQRGDLGVGQGNGMFPQLTHLVQGDGSQARRDGIRARKRGGGGPVVPPMATTRNREKPIYGLILHELGQSQIHVLKERS